MMRKFSIKFNQNWTKSR